MHYKSNANLIFFLRSITLQKRYCKNIYNDTYLKNILSVPRTVFRFLLPVHVIFVEHFEIIFVQRPDEQSRANLPSFLTRKYTSFAFSVKSDSYTNGRIHVANRIKKTLSSSKLAESLQANETTAVHLDAAQPFWKSYPLFSLLSSSHLPPQQHGFSLSNRRYILWRTSRSKPSEFRLRR